MLVLNVFVYTFARWKTIIYNYISTSDRNDLSIKYLSNTEKDNLRIMTNF